MNSDTWCSCCGCMGYHRVGRRCSTCGATCAWKKHLEETMARIRSSYPPLCTCCGCRIPHDRASERCDGCGRACVLHFTGLTPRYQSAPNDTPEAQRRLAAESAHAKQDPVPDGGC